MVETRLHRRSLLRWGAALPAALAAGCSLPGAGDPPRQFLLSPLPARDVASGPNWRLAVAEPRALRMLDSSRIVNRAGPLELEYFAGNDWADRAPAMVQLLIVRSFQNASRIEAVRDDAPGPQAAFLMSSILQDFQAEAGPGGHVAHVGLVATLTALDRRRDIGRRVFEASVPASGEAMTATVAAFDQALARVLSDLVTWTAATAGAGQGSS